MGTTTLLLSDDEVRRLIDFPSAIKSIEASYDALGKGAAINRPRTDLHLKAADDGRVLRFKTLEGAVPAEGTLVLRINSDIVQWPHIDGRVQQLKIPSINGRYLGLLLLFQINNGELLAIMHDSEIQRTRVGCTNAVAARHLARADVQTLCLLGSGRQASTLVRAMASCVPLRHIKVFSPRLESRERFAAELAPLVGIPIEPVATAEQAKQDAEIIAAATNSLDAVITADDFRPGLHVSLVKQWELSEDGYKQADIVVLNTKEGKGQNLFPVDFQVKDVPYLSGDYRPYNWDLLANCADLPDVVSGRCVGRKTLNDVTVFNNNSGIGTQFVGIATQVYRRAILNGVGRELPSDWFTEESQP